MKPFSASDFPTEGNPPRPYHISIPPEFYASSILIVGDPDRAAGICDRPMLHFGGPVTESADPIRDLAKRLETFVQTGALVDTEPTHFFERVLCDFFHRGLRAITGITRKHGDRVMVITSGMGTPSEEIGLTELIAMCQIDFERRIPKDQWKPFDIIRVGTSGALQSSTPLGTAVISEMAVGLDNTGLFTEVPADRFLLDLEADVYQAITDATPDESRFKGKIHPYAARANSEVWNALVETAKTLGYPYELGVTASNAGFFHAQGRSILPVKPTVPDIDAVLAGLSKYRKIINMEMEASYLFHLCSALGHRAGAVCLAIANRRTDGFDHDYKENALKVAEIGLEALHRLQAA